MVMGECGKERKEIKYILRLPGDLTWRTSRSHNGISMPELILMWKLFVVNKVSHRLVSFPSGCFLRMHSRRSECPRPNVSYQLCRKALKPMLMKNPIAVLLGQEREKKHKSRRGKEMENGK